MEEEEEETKMCIPSSWSDFFASLSSSAVGAPNVGACCILTLGSCSLNFFIQKVLTEGIDHISIFFGLCCYNHSFINIVRVLSIL